MLESWTRAVIRHRVIVLGIWVILTSLGAFAGSKLEGHLTTSLSVPQSDSAKADQILTDRFHENIEGSFTIFFKFSSASKSQILGFKSKISAATQSIPGASVKTQKAIGGILFASVATPYSLTEAAKNTDLLRSALDRQGLRRALITGPPAINHDVTPLLGSDLKNGQHLALLLTLLILILVLGLCRAVFIPFLFALATISLTLGIVYLLSHRFLMVSYIPNIVELIGLGLAIDYSLLIVHRLRRELMASRQICIDDAILNTMQTAGKTVLISGISVAIGLATLFLVPIPFVRSLGVAGLLVPTISVLAVLTLQPALLSFLGRNGATPWRYRGLMAQSDLMNSFWAKVGKFVIKRPKVIFTFSSLVLILLGASIFWLQTTPSSLTAIPHQLESAQAIALATGKGGPGIITPNEIVVDLGAAHLATQSSVEGARSKFVSQLSQDSEVVAVASGNTGSFIDPTGQFLRVYVFGNHELGAKATKDLVNRIRGKYVHQSAFPAGTKIFVGGAPAQGADLLKVIFNTFPWIVFLMLFLAYLLLLRTFKSLILPLKAILMDLISIMVAFGSMVCVFKFGFGKSIFGTYQLDQVEAWVLIFLFAVLFGLSMDYEVFIVNRMKEAKENGATNNEAIVEGLANTGGVVTAAAIIFVGALSGLIVGHFAGLQELGIGLAVGVLVDATIIRGLLLPSSMVLLGRWNWWLPASVARAIKTKASPLEVREARP